MCYQTLNKFFTQLLMIKKEWKRLSHHELQFEIQEIFAHFIIIEMFANDFLPFCSLVKAKS